MKRAEERVGARVGARDGDAEPADDRREEREERPVPASQRPSVSVWPDRFITYASAKTQRIVTIAQPNWRIVSP